MFDKRRKKAAFLKKKSYIEKRLQHDVMEDGIAYVPCKVEGIDDVISKFSVEGCESLDSAFAEYVIESVDYIPSEYPVVLQICGPEFSDTEKGIITDAISSEWDYRLGMAEEDSLRRKRRFLGMMAGTVITGCMLGFAKQFFADFPLEFSFVLFWLFADALVRYIFIEKLDFREEKVRAGRLASMKVVFNVSR